MLYKRRIIILLIFRILWRFIAFVKYDFTVPGEIILPGFLNGHWRLFYYKRVLMFISHLLLFSNIFLESLGSLSEI